MSSEEQDSERHTSDRKLEANRANAQNSSGPKTDAGKAIVSRNATKHGLLSNALTFDNEEEREELERFREELQEELAPVGIVENILVDEIVVSQWKLRVIQGYSTREINSRRKAAITILKACTDLSGLAVNPFPEGSGRGADVCSGWECKELIVKVGAEAADNSPTFELEEDAKPKVHFEAKLGTSAETFLRYEIAWKKDMYRALETLRGLQQLRKANQSAPKGLSVQ